MIEPTKHPDDILEAAWVAKAWVMTLLKALETDGKTAGVANAVDLPCVVAA